MKKYTLRWSTARFVLAVSTYAQPAPPPTPPAAPPQQTPPGPTRTTTCQEPCTARRPLRTSSAPMTVWLEAADTALNAYRPTQLQTA